MSANRCLLRVPMALKILNRTFKDMSSDIVFCSYPPHAAMYRLPTVSTPSGYRVQPIPAPTHHASSLDTVHASAGVDSGQISSNYHQTSDSSACNTYADFSGEHEQQGSGDGSPPEDSQLRQQQQGDVRLGSSTGGASNSRPQEHLLHHNIDESKSNIIQVPSMTPHGNGRTSTTTARSGGSGIITNATPPPPSITAPLPSTNAGHIHQHGHGHTHAPISYQMLSAAPAAYIPHPAATPYYPHPQQISIPTVVRAL